MNDNAKYNMEIDINNCDTNYHNGQSLKLSIQNMYFDNRLVSLTNSNTDHVATGSLVGTLSRDSASFASGVHITAVNI
jgi:hypothetical protein